MKERCKDLIGATVRLLEPLETAGGESFRKGSLMKVSGSHRGRFVLETLKRDGDGHWRGVSFVARRKFELVRFVPALSAGELLVLGELAEPNNNSDGGWRIPYRWVNRAKELVRLGLATEIDEHLRYYALTPAGRAYWKNHGAT